MKHDSKGQDSLLPFSIHGGVTSTFEALKQQTSGFAGGNLIRLALGILHD